LFFARWTRWLLTHPKQGWALVVLGFVVLGSGLVNTRVSLSFESFVGTRTGESDLLRQHQKEWGSDDRFTFIVVQAQNDDGNLLSVDLLQAQEQTLVELEKLDQVGRGIGLSRVPLIRDDAAFSAPTVLDVAQTVSLPQLQQRVLEDETLVPRLLSKDLKTTTMLVELAIDVDDIQAYGPPVKRMRQRLAEIEQQGQLRFVVAGIPAVRTDFVDLLIYDQGIFISAAMLCALLLLIFLFRRVHGVLIPMTAAMIPTGELFGFMGHTSEPIGVLSQVFATLLPVIALADTLHVITRLHQTAHAHYEAQGITDWNGDLDDAAVRDDLIVDVMRHVGFACLLTSLTTAVGFLSLAIADMRILVNFGLYAGFGVLLAYLNFIVVVPLLLRHVRRIPSRREGQMGDGAIERLLTTSVQGVLVRPWATIVVALLACGVAGWSAQNVSFDNHLNDILGPKHSVTRANTIVDQHLGGVVGIQVALSSTTSLQTVENLKHIETFEKWARAQDIVRHVEGPAIRLAQASQVVLGKRALPDDDAALAQVMLLLDGQLPTDDVLRAGGKKARVVLSIPDVGGTGVEAFRQTLEPALQRMLVDKGISAKATGVSYVAYQSFNRISRELGVSLLSALAIILVFIAVLFRSALWGLLALVPNAVPLLFTLGVMGAFRWPLDPPSTIVYVVGLGIAVDDTIHILARIREEQDKGRPLDDALRIAVTSTGRAVSMTSLILCVGFGINGFSSFPMNSIFGVLGAVSVAAAWVCDVFFLPAYWKVFARDEAASTNASTDAA